MCDTNNRIEIYLRTSIGTHLNTKLAEVNIKIVIMATGITARRSTNHQNSTNYTSNQSEKKIMDKQIFEIRIISTNSENIFQEGWPRPFTSSRSA